MSSVETHAPFFLDCDTGIDDALARARVGSHAPRSRLPGVCAAPDPLQLCRTDAPWSHRR